MMAIKNKIALIMFILGSVLIGAFFISNLLNKNDSIIVFDNEELDLIYGDTVNLKYKLNLNKDEQIVWTSSNPQLVKVENGTITVLKNESGEVIITATLLKKNVSSSIKLNVKRTDILVSNISLDKENITLKYGESSKINAIVYPSEASNKVLKWSSSDNSIIKVNNGTIKVIANKDANVKVYVEAPGGTIKKEINVTVKKVDLKVDVKEINFDKKTLTLYYNTSDTINATVLPTNASNKDIEWSSSDNNMVTVDNGVVKAIANIDGVVTITAKSVDGGKITTAKVTVRKVNIKVSDITLDKKKINLSYGQTEKITVLLLPTNATNKEIEWSSSNNKLVTVNNGVVKAVADLDGTAIITAKSVDSGKEVTAEVIVKKNIIKVTGVKISNSSDKNLYLNSKNDKNLKLTANISPNNATNKKISWSSSNPSVATIDENGNVEAKSLGKTTVTVTTDDGNFMSSYELNVRQKTIVVITASAGKRMYDYFKTYTSAKNFNYKFEDETLKYVYKSGSGFEYQYGEGLGLAKEYLNKNFANVKNYVDLAIFFTMTGNSVKNFTCDQINTSKEYYTIADKYNRAIQEVKNEGFSNIKGFVISHSPLNSKEAINKFGRTDIVYSTNAKVCYSGYRTAWKYLISNRRISSIIKNGSYANLTFVDNYSNFVVINDEDKKTFTWLREYHTTDGLHWDEPTTKVYMQLAFDSAGM